MTYDVCVCVQLVRLEEIAGRNADEEALLTYLAKFVVVAQSLRGARHGSEQVFGQMRAYRHVVLERLRRPVKL